MSAELKSKSDISIVLFLFTALAVFGVAGGGYFVHDYARARASVSWPAVDGIVLSQLDDEHAKVRYVYSIGGRSYEATRERMFLSRLFSEKERDYRPGEKVTVYVNPQDHGFAVLRPGGAGVAFILCSILSGLAVFFGFGGVFWALSRSSDSDFALAEDAA
ncbi:DUF3592 domain-containing protein [Hyphococcus flavus]|uniref:DUF3592 domain-containing protein n=1 Tax=Hyphococcus flavus TaxID=1866326 RepID=A0AAF0CF82_9PROT|nr:DUF3592 domain-containing protein [Hyphococcus flavus]WDI30598.1 DUF3592 domain-containing protein [Hyphococcus flavus]